VTRRIAVFTSSRADLGPLGPVIGALDAEPNLDLIVIATGTHLLDDYGGRLADIPVSQGTLEIVDADFGNTSAVELGYAYAQIASGVSAVLARQSVDILVLLGDRWELLAAAGAALLHGVAIAHLHGGETTEGAIDERIRHGITKLSDLHLCASDDSARRIRRLGEEHWRIIVCGAPGLDRIGAVQPMSTSALEELVGGPVHRPLGVVVYHPTTVNRVDIRARSDAVLDAAAASLGTALVLYPGADPGAEEVINAIEDAHRRHDNVTAIRNLGNDYIALLKCADVLLGNSSSGIIEAASIGLPAVDIGDRQRGRVRPGNVLHVDDDETAVHSAIKRATSTAFRGSLIGLQNPYGDGRASARIVTALREAPLARLSRKSPIDVGSPAASVPAITIRTGSTLRDAMIAIDRGRAQIALVVYDDGTLAGTVSDGDVRRALISGAPLDAGIGPHMAAVPVVATTTDSPSRVLAMMEREQVTQVPIVDDAGRVVGIHLMRAIVGEVLNVESLVPEDATDA
jgi:UDP-N-acetylglucosamine 2-epimerase (non-hydrolysing)